MAEQAVHGFLSCTISSVHLTDKWQIIFIVIGNQLAILVDQCLRNFYYIIKLSSLMFEFKLSNLLFGPVSVKAKLMTTSIEDMKSIISSAASTVEFSYKYKPCIPYHMQRCYCCEVQSNV